MPVHRNAIEESANANIMYAADGHIYMHVSGDRVGSLTIGGLAFSNLCESSNKNNSDDNDTNNQNTVPGMNEQVTGLERILLWYRRNRVSNSMQNNPIEITFRVYLEIKSRKTQAFCKLSR